MIKSNQMLYYADKPSEFLEAFWTLPNGKAPKLYDYQKEFLDYPYKEGPRRLEIVNKSRQTGFSTVCITGRSFHEGYFHLRPSMMFVSASERQAIDLLNNVKNGIDSLPKQLQPQLEKDKETEIKFKNSYRIISVPQSESSVRGYNGDVSLDEFGWLQKAKQIWTALMPSMRGGNRISVISTPYGKKGEYYRLWHADQNDGYQNLPIEKQWKKFIVPWQNCPDLVPDIDVWRANMSEDQFRQEFECEFVDESTAFFTLDLITSVVDAELVNAKGYVGPNRVTLGCDFAKKIDQSVFTAVEHFDNGFKKVIAIEVLTKKPYEYQLRYLVDMFNAFNATKLRFDETGVGVALGEPLRRELGASKCEGISFTNSIKERMIYNLKMLMEKSEIALPDHKLLRAQLHGMQRTVTEHGNVRYGHEQNSHDDCTWSLSLALYEEANKKNYGGSFFSCNL